VNPSLYSDMRPAIFLAAVAAAILTGVLTPLFASWARRRNYLDVPNHRSSHVVATPRTGGIALVLGVLGGVVVLYLFGSGLGVGLPPVLAGALAIALLGLVDDFQHLSALVRLAVQTAVAIAVVMTSGDAALPGLPSPMAGAVTVLWLVTLTNAFNFMDGIDGIAGAQALLAGFGWFIVGLLSEAPFVAGLGLLLAAASAGFLLHNWHPARVFMGDAGSGFFGFLFAALPLVSATRNDTLWLCAGLLMWPFLADTAVTLLRRASRGENVLSAHRSHFYQRLVLTGRSHRYVALLYAGLAALGGLAAVSLIYGSTAALVGSITAIAAAALAVWWNVRSREASPGGLDHARV
jgi:UDP-N-acetylmuramyl pentapeptide phosphotransferase/UDP-N-acetylglucosamine-1-phosphate transferase